MQDSHYYLRRRQKDVLTEMIRAALPMDNSGNPISDSASFDNDPYGPGGSGDDPNAPPTTWRLLIFDDWGMNIIAPLLKVGDLRSFGITLYMHIQTERDAVPGAPAIYFCAPTEENAALIAKDCGDRLYEWVYINFTAQAPRPLLEHLAQKLSDTGLTSIRHIRLYDRTLSYVALDNDLFSLMLPKSFLTLNRNNVADSEVEEHLTALVQGVSHVLLSLQLMPIIAHSKTGVAEEVARRLSVCLNDAVRETPQMPPSSIGGRPLLLLVDRSSDLATALHHPFSYRGLLVEVGNMQLNKCTVRATDGKDEMVEIDPDHDAFYRENANLDFSAIGGKIQTALQQYKVEYQALADEGAGGSDDSYADANTMSKLLATAPLLAERKRCLDTHAKLAVSFLRVIQDRLLDHFHGVELSILQQGGLDRGEFTRLLNNTSCSLEDRQRLFLIAYLMLEPNSDDSAFVERQSSLLLPPGAEASGATTFPAYKYLQHLRGWSQQGKAAGAPAAASSASEGIGWGFAQQLAKNIANSLGHTVETELPLTKLVRALLQDTTEMGGGRGTDNDKALSQRLRDTVAAIDPRQRRPADLKQMRFSQVIVMVVGGGNAAEYDDLKLWESANPGKSVIYGCTGMMSGEDILKQLTLLGSEI